MKSNRLHKAIVSGDIKGVKEFVDDDTVRWRNKSGRQAIHVAVLHERIFIVKYLLRLFPFCSQQKDFVSLIFLFLYLFPSFCLFFSFYLFFY